MVAVVHDRSIAISPAECDQTKQTAKSPCLRVACLRLLPLVVVTAGAVLFGIGMDSRSYSAAGHGKNILSTAGMVLYIIGVIYFVIINLADHTYEQEDEDEVLASDTTDYIDTETHKLGRGSSVTLV